MEAVAQLGRIDQSKLGSIEFGVVGPTRARRKESDPPPRTTPAIIDSCVPLQIQLAWPAPRTWSSLIRESPQGPAVRCRCRQPWPGLVALDRQAGDNPHEVRAHRLQLYDQGPGLLEPVRSRRSSRSDATLPAMVENAGRSDRACARPRVIAVHPSLAGRSSVRPIGPARRSGNHHKSCEAHPGRSRRPSAPRLGRAGWNSPRHPMDHLGSTWNGEESVNDPEQFRSRDRLGQEVIHAGLEAALAILSP